MHGFTYIYISDFSSIRKKKARECLEPLHIINYVWLQYRLPESAPSRYISADLACLTKDTLQYCGANGEKFVKELIKK